MKRQIKCYSVSTISKWLTFYRDMRYGILTEGEPSGRKIRVKPLPLSIVRSVFLSNLFVLHLARPCLHISGPEMYIPH